LDIQVRLNLSATPVSVAVLPDGFNTVNFLLVATNFVSLALMFFVQKNNEAPTLITGEAENTSMVPVMSW